MTSGDDHCSPDLAYSGAETRSFGSEASSDGHSSPAHEFPGTEERSFGSGASSDGQFSPALGCSGAGEKSFGLRVSSNDHTSSALGPTKTRVIYFVFFTYFCRSLDGESLASPLPVIPLMMQNSRVVTQ